MSNFDLSNISDHILHDAVEKTLSGCKLVRRKYEYNFRCPLCGDSKKNIHSRRGYIYFDKGIWIYKCFNGGCQANDGLGILKFLKKRDEEVYKNVIFHGYATSSKPRSKPVEINEAEKTYKPTGHKVFKPGELIDIFSDHPTAKKALNICIQRKLRKDVYYRWFVCLKDPKFYTRINGSILLNDRGRPIGNEYADRIIIPYYKYGGSWSQFDARDINENSLLRYRNLDGVDREFYNLDWLDTKKPFFLLEGALDSSFIKNAVGFGGIKHLKELLKQRPDILENKENGTIIWDNDESGIDEIPNSVKLGFNWFNWESIEPIVEYKERKIKDINDAILYSDIFEQDDDEYVTYESLSKYIERPDLIKVNILYGNRYKMKKEKQQSSLNDYKNNIGSKENNPFLKGMKSEK